MMERIEPGPGQESVWDYPRPPRVEPIAARVRVEFAAVTVADTHGALRVCETASPPTVYLPPGDVRLDLLRESPRRSLCEFKGHATYWDLVVADRESPAAAWSYAAPWPGFEALADFISFYPARVDACYLGDERVGAQESDFYGGWITSNVVGPFKGPPGTLGW